ncbi:MAG: succinate dehydrogenase, cytochrome b556 subunit [Cocleimonas sp.]
MNKQAPVYLNLFKIKLPLTGIVSLLHRVTGVLLFLAIPFSIYLLQMSLKSKQGFLEALDLVNSPLLIFIELIIFSALIYHLFAGIRFLIMDSDIGVDLKTAMTSSWVVIIATVFFSALFLAMRVLS